MGSVLPELIHPHRTQGVVHPLPDLGGGDPQVLRCEGYILLHHVGDDLVVRVLEHHAHRAPDVQQAVLIHSVDAIHIHFAAAGQEDGVHVLGEGGFAAAVVAQNSHKSALLDGQVHPVQHNGGDALGGGVGEAESFRADDRVFQSKHPLF